jgi:hypothetical protein
MNRIPFGAAVKSCSSGRASTSMVGGRSTIKKFGSPTEKTVLPLGARRSVVCRSAGVNDCCRRAPVSRASETLWAHCCEFLLAVAFWRVVAIALLVLPPRVVRRCCSGPAIQ